MLNDAFFIHVGGACFPPLLCTFKIEHLKTYKAAYLYTSNIKIGLYCIYEGSVFPPFSMYI